MNQLPTYDNMAAAYEYLLNGTSAIVNSNPAVGISKHNHLRSPIGMEQLGITQ
jgi:hypothetical protein